MAQFFIDNWYLFVAAIVSGGLLLRPMLGQASGGAKVSAADAVHLINREKAVLIDVSEPAEYAAGHAIGARSVPLANLEGSRDLPKNKALPLVVVCPTGTRAVRAVATLKKLGFANARALAGGLNAWRAANLPVEKTCLSHDAARQDVHDPRLPVLRPRQGAAASSAASRRSTRSASISTPAERRTMIAAHRPPHGAADLHRRDPRRRLRRPDRARPARRPVAVARDRRLTRRRTGRASLSRPPLGDNFAASPPHSAGPLSNRDSPWPTDQTPVFQIQRIYLKDLSLEQPNSPQILLEQGQPQVEINLALGAEPGRRRRSTKSPSPPP